jgi:hypothetical protein
VSLEAVLETEADDGWGMSRRCRELIMWLTGACGGSCAIRGDRG